MEWRRVHSCSTWLLDMAAFEHDLECEANRLRPRTTTRHRVAANDASISFRPDRQLQCIFLFCGLWRDRASITFVALIWSF